MENIHTTSQAPSNMYIKCWALPSLIPYDQIRYHHPNFPIHFDFRVVLAFFFFLIQLLGTQLPKDTKSWKGL